VTRDDDNGDDLRQALRGLVKQVRRSEARRRRRLATEAPDAVKRALAKGLDVRRYSVNGVTIELGEPNKAAPSNNDLDNWLAKHPNYARPPQRH
jgi:hypothetical protein